MAMNGLEAVAQVLEQGHNEIHVEPATAARARLPIDRMLAFTAALKGGNDAGALVPNIGAA
jgi:quinolinate synthase